MKQLLLSLGGAAVLAAACAHAEFQDRFKPATAPSIEPWTRSETVAFRNAFWFDGRRFERQAVVYTKDGRIVGARTPGRVDRVVDLSGRYVIPPLGDAHTHVFDGPFRFQQQRAKYLTEGVFYALTTTAPASGVTKIRSEFAGPTNVDVVNAQAGFTGPKSHPAEIYNAYALGVFDWREQHRQFERLRSSSAAADDAFFVVRNESELAQKWRLVELRRPDMIKVFLRSSERFHPEGPSNLADGGIDPKLLPVIVRRAHAAGLRVAVANSSVIDFQATLAARGDMVTHLPCYQSGGIGPYQELFPDTDATCMVSPADARRAARQGVVSTLITSEWAKDDRSPDAIRREVANIRTLQRAGAKIALGSDAYGDTPVAGLIAASSKGPFSRWQLLRWATVETPQAIFPGRKVGCLQAGCEASFLVLKSNPTKNMTALRDISTRVKDGLLLRTTR